MAEKFSLKDELFNPEKVKYLSGLIFAVYPNFDTTQFKNEICSQFPTLELKERIAHIRKMLKKFLPKDYISAVQILINSLPEECDANLSDDDFGDFIFSPFSDFVAFYGCEKKYLDFSLQALQKITTRFSAEDSIRFFLRKFPAETLAELKKWTQHSHYHIRRLASEGTRPKLPWSQKVELDNKWVIDNVLANLFFDTTRFVVRSVANHLNDISKDNADLVVDTLKKWKEIGLQSEKEMNYLISHSLRALVKKGNKNALELLGYSASPEVSVNSFEVLTHSVVIGDSIYFSFDIVAEKTERLMIDYSIYFQSKSGKLLPKVFKIKKIKIEKGETLHIEKKHRLRIMTTKKLYAGLHKIELQINGKKMGILGFTLLKK